jgi:3-isopropylmalate/(R)-2-methylmalate dehydratase large subunit
MGKTLYDKLWDSHVIHVEEDGTTLLYFDRQLLHEVTSAQAFEGLRQTGRPIWRKSANLAVCDHSVPTTNRKNGIADPVSKLQVDTLDANCKANSIAEFKMNDIRQGIVDIIGPEQGATLPGTTIVCGDSHTSTHGAFAKLGQVLPEGAQLHLEHVFVKDDQAAVELHSLATAKNGTGVRSIDHG